MEIGGSGGKGQSQPQPVSPNLVGTEQNPLVIHPELGVWTLLLRGRQCQREGTAGVSTAESRLPVGTVAGSDPEKGEPVPHSHQLYPQLWSWAHHKMPGATGQHLWAASRPVSEEHALMG